MHSEILKSKKVMSGFGRVVNAAYLVGAVPVGWDYNNQILRLPKQSMLIFALSAWHLTILFAQTVHCTWGLVVKLRSFKEFDMDLAFHMIYFTSEVSFSIVHLSFIRNKALLVNFFKELMSILKELVPERSKVSERNRDLRREKLLSKLLQFVFPAWGWNVVALVGFYLHDPLNTRYIYYRFEGSSFAFVFLGLVEVHHTSLIIYWVILYCMFGLLCLTFVFLGAIRFLSERVDETKGILECTRNLQMYRRIQILFGMYADCMESTWPAFVYVNIVNHVLFIYLVVRGHDKLNVFALGLCLTWASTYGLLEGVMYFSPGQLIPSCQLLISKLKVQAGQHVYNKRLVSGLNVIKVKVKNGIPILRISSLLVLHMVCSITVNLLLIG